MPAGGPADFNVSPVALAAKKIEELVKPSFTIKEMAMGIKPTVIQTDDMNNMAGKRIEENQYDGECSLGSIDEGGAMLRMLHNTIGNKSLANLDLQQVPPAATNSRSSDVHDPKNQGNETDKL